MKQQISLIILMSLVLLMFFSTTSWAQTDFGLNEAVTEFYLELVKDVFPIKAMIISTFEDTAHVNLGKAHLEKGQKLYIFGEAIDIVDPVTGELKIVIEDQLGILEIRVIEDYLASGSLTTFEQQKVEIGDYAYLQSHDRIRNAHLLGLSFSDGSISALNQRVYQILLEQMALDHHFNLRSEQQLWQELSDLGVSSAEIFNRNQAENLGQQLGLDLVLTGSIIDQGLDYLLEVIVIDIENEMQLATRQMIIPKTQTIKELAQNKIEGPTKPLLSPKFSDFSVQPSEIYVQVGDHFLIETFVQDEKGEKVGVKALAEYDFSHGRFEKEQRGKLIFVATAVGSGNFFVIWNNEYRKVEYEIEKATSVLTEIQLYPDDVKLELNTTKEFVVQGYDQYGEKMDVNVNWFIRGNLGELSTTQGKTNLLTVGEVGSGYIEVQIGNMSSRVNIETFRYPPQLTTITFSPGGETFLEGDVFRFRAVPLDQYGLEMEITGFEWELEGPGRLTEIGDAVLFESSPDTKGKIHVALDNVTSFLEWQADKTGLQITEYDPRYLASIELKPTQAHLRVGQTIKLQLKAFDQFGDELELTTIADWTLDPRLGDLDLTDPINPVFTATEVGEGIIYVELANLRTEMSIKVTPLSFEKLEFIISPVKLRAGQEAIVELLAYDQDGELVAVEVDWILAADLEQVAVSQQQITVKTKAPGRYKLTAIVEGVSKDFTLDVYKNYRLTTFEIGSLKQDMTSYHLYSGGAFRFPNWELIILAGLGLGTTDPFALFDSSPSLALREEIRYYVWPKRFGVFTGLSFAQKIATTFENFKLEDYILSFDFGLSAGIVYQISANFGLEVAAQYSRSLVSQGEWDQFIKEDSWSAFNHLSINFGLRRGF